MKDFVTPENQDLRNARMPSVRQECIDDASLPHPLLCAVSRLNRGPCPPAQAVQPHGCVLSSLTSPRVLRNPDPAKTGVNGQKLMPLQTSSLTVSSERNPTPNSKRFWMCSGTAPVGTFSVQINVVYSRNSLELFSRDHGFHFRPFWHPVGARSQGCSLYRKTTPQTSL